ncbi:MAG: DNA polymerase III subunit delta [Tunicatimonas sp.]
MQFSDIVGLHETKQHLMQAADRGKVAHAQLFVGPPGSANLAMALAYATYLNCEDRQADGSCGASASGAKMHRYIHPDLHFVFPVSSTKSITGKDVVSDSYIEPWREFLHDQPYGDPADWSVVFGGENKQLNISKEESRNIIRKLSLTAYESHYKVVIIWMPEYLHPAAANGILKILEEPPAKTVFLLVASEVDRLLPTIISRVQIVNIRAFTPDEVATYLREQDSTASAARIEQAATLSEGNLPYALKLLNEVQEDQQQLFQDWMRFCYARDYSALIAMTEQFHKLGKEGQKRLFHYGLGMMREVLMGLAIQPGAGANDGTLIAQERQLLRVQGAALRFVTNFGKVMDFEKVERLTKLFNEGHVHLERNVNPKMIFLDTSLTIAQAIKA